MPTPSSLGTPPTVVPSEVTRFLQGRGWHLTPFKTTTFAANFALTVLEAQAVLNQYVEEALLTFAGKVDGIEAWLPSRDGLQVFGLGQTTKRLTKKNLQSVKTALTYLAPALSSYGVNELSWGGRPAFGKANGTLAVGVRLDHEPYTRTEDVSILERVLTAVTAAVAGDCYSVLLFQNEIPERLRKREVLAGPAPGELIVASDAELDYSETRQAAYLNTHLQLKGYPEGLRTFRHHRFSPFDNEGPWHLLNYLQKESIALPASIHCLQSSINLKDGVSSLLKAHATDVAFRTALQRGRERDESYGLTALAKAEYFASLGKLDAYCQNFDPEDYGWYEPPNPPSEGELKLKLLAGIQLRWERIAEARAVKEKKKAVKRPPDIRYYAVFDCINFPKPYLAGFVRQPASNDAGLNWLYDFWSGVLRGLKGSPGNTFQSAGFNASAISLFDRPATPAEIEAYDAVSKEAGHAVKCIVFAAGRESGMAVSTRRFEQTSDIEAMPEVLATAEMPAPVLPKLLLGRYWTLQLGPLRDGPALFDLVDGLPPALKKTVGGRLVNTERVLMADFAANAARKPCRDPVVLASKVTEAWDFVTREGYWLGTAQGENWSVALESEDDALTLHVQLDDFHHTQQLAPLTDDRPHYGLPYQGRLSSILPIMEKLREMKMAGVDTLWAAFQESDGETEGFGKPDWFLHVLDRTLRHGNYYDEWDFTDWPYLRVDDAVDI